MIKKIFSWCKKHGFTRVIPYVWKNRVYIFKNLNHLTSGSNVTKKQYQQWRKKHEAYNLIQVGRNMQSFTVNPKVSIITPVYNVDPKYLDACIQSVLDQYYEDWELCLYDDASTNEGTLNCLKHWEGRDPRIKVRYGETNGHISHSTNQAVTLATGSWFAFLDHDDTITPWALYEVLRELQNHPEAKYIYTDEDKLDVHGRRYGPFFKPDFDIDYLTSCNYICHFRWCRADTYRQVGGERVGYEGSQDHDLALRVANLISPDEFLHVSSICYNWRVVPGSTSHDPKSKSYAFTNGTRAVQEYFDRKSEAASVQATSNLGTYRVTRTLLGNPLVSIIIPFRDQATTTEVCVESILSKSTYTNYEILLVDNQSVEEATKAMVEKYTGNPKIRILPYDKPFNYSAINNYAATEAQGEYLILLNNDTEVITPNWIEEMLGHAQRPEVGAVGVKLLYLDNTVQHAGVVVGIGGLAAHIYHRSLTSDTGYGGGMACTRQYSAVTAACLMVAKSKFQEIGGLDEVNLPVAYNDVDFCLRLKGSRYVNIFTPYAQLYHYESKSRGSDIDDLEMLLKNTLKYLRIWKERVYFVEKWQSVIIGTDTSYSKHLSKVHPYTINI